MSQQFTVPSELYSRRTVEVILLLLDLLLFAGIYIFQKSFYNQLFRFFLWKQLSNGTGQWIGKLFLYRPGGTFKILGGQPSISVNFYSNFKILFFSETCWQGQDRGKTGTRHGDYREKKEIRQKQVNKRQGKDRDKIREEEGKKVGRGDGGVGEVREW